MVRTALILIGLRSVTVAPKRLYREHVLSFTQTTRIKRGRPESPSNVSLLGLTTLRFTEY